MTLAAVLFTSPLMLLGALAVAGPVVAHLLSRRARQRVVFPTLMLLKETAAGQSRLFRLRRWLVLLLRCLAIAAIAAAFSQPLWLDAASIGEGGDESSSVVVLDVSASMGQRSDGVSAVSAMQAAVMRLLDQLEPGRDAANIIYAAHRPRAAFPNLITNVDALKGDLRGLAGTQESADLPAALGLARQLLQSRRGARRIVVFSDLQGTTWNPVSQDAADASAPRMTLVPIGEDGAVNTVISSPRLHPARPVAGRPAQVSAVLFNAGDRERVVDVSLLINGRTEGVVREIIPPFQRRPVFFSFTVATSGIHEALLVAGGDDLDIDDRRAFIIDAASRSRIALVSDDDQPLGAAFYLRHALAPRGEDDVLEILPLRPSDVTAEKLQGCEAVVLCDVTGLTPEAARAIVAHTAAGAGLAIFFAAPGSAAVMQQLQQQVSGTGRRLFPIQPLARRDRTGADAAAFITGGDWDHPALRSFDEAAKDALSRIPVYIRHDVTPLQGDAAVLLRYGDGVAALTASSFGEGVVMTANFGPAAEASDLGKHGVFVALMQGLLDTLRSASQPLEPVVGPPLTLPIDASVEAVTLAATGPDGRPRSLEVSRNGDRAAATIMPVDQAGFFTLASAGIPIARVPVHVDERESDLRRIRVDEARRRLGAGSDDAAVQTAGAAEVNHERPGTPLWPAAVMAAMAALGLEMLLLSFWKR